MYSEKVVDYFMNPRNSGKMDDANAIGEVGNPKCGDVMKIYLKINDQEVIEDIKFETFGCAATIYHKLHDNRNGQGQDDH